MPTSRATRVTSSAKARSWSTIVLMVSFSSATSPRASTVIFWDRSPRATAVVTWAMLRTWPVRLPASWLTFSVRSFQVPETPWHFGLAAQAAFGAHLTGHAGDLVGEGPQLVHHRVDGVLQFGHLAPRLYRDLLGQVAPGHCRGHLGDVAHLAGQVAGQLVYVVGQGFPGARDARDFGLAAEDAVDAHFAGHPGHLRGKTGELVHHGVDRFFELGHLAPGLYRDLLGQVAPGHGRGHLGDVAHLAGQVAGQLVYVVGQGLPGARDARHLGLAAEVALGAHFTGHPGHFGGERRKLVHHRVDGPFQVEDLAAHVDLDLLRQVAGWPRRW